MGTNRVSPKKSAPVIVEVVGGSTLKEFLNLPHKIYTEEDTRYVHPLRLHMKMMMGRLGRPKRKFFIAKVDGETVARVGVSIHQHGDKKTLNFGFFEAVEGHAEAVKSMFQLAQQVAPELKMVGPFHFRMEDPYVGVLVDGFDRDPYFLMPYNKPYYDDLLRAAGFDKMMDLFTYEVENKGELGSVICDNAQRAKDSGISIRTLNPKKMRAEVKTIVRIFNDALSKNWGFEEFVDDQVKEMVSMFKLFIDPRIVAFAQKDGKDVGCLIMLPNYNPVIKSAKGRLTPNLIWNYLRRRKLVKTARGYALGVLREYHGLGIGSALTKAMFEIGERVGYREGEISWILANNGPMNELSKAMGGSHNKIYRIYEKSPVETLTKQG